MSIEFWFTERSTIRIQCGTDVIEVPLPHAADAVSAAPAAGPAPGGIPEPAPGPAPGPAPAERPTRSVLPRDPDPVKHGRPKPGPGVMAIIPGDEHAVPLTPDLLSDFAPIGRRWAREPMLTVDALQVMPRTHLLLEVERQRSLAGVSSRSVRLAVVALPGRP